MENIKNIKDYTSLKKSAGIVILNGNKILLCHPTNARWHGTYSIPKGALEDGESNIDAAIRETQEEVGINVPRDLVENSIERFIDYKDKNGKLYKRVYYYVVRIIDLPDILPYGQLQEDEVNWAGFLDYETAKKKIFWRFMPMLKLINN